MKCKHAALLIAVVFAVVVFAPSSAMAQVSLGTAQNFGVLGGSAVTNTGATVVTGEVGVSAGTSITGFPPGVIVGGTTHSNDAVAMQAQTDLTAAYNAAAGLPCGTVLTGQDLGGLVLTPGVYCFASSAGLTGILTLNMQGNPNALFVFQIGSTLTTASGSSVQLINNGGSCPTNVFWQVGSSATLGTGTFLQGDILAQTSITLTTGATSTGRLLARTAAVTLDTNNVSPCALAVVPPGGGEPAGGPTLDGFGLAALMVLLVVAGLFVMNRLSL